MIKCLFENKIKNFFNFFRGVQSNVLFFNHRIPEEDNHFSKSKSNPGEAQIILSFADYLLSQNKKPSQIS